MATRDPSEVINQLSPADALAVLKALSREDKSIAARAAEIAAERLSVSDSEAVSVDLEEVAFDLYYELELLEVEDVWEQAGRTRHGYVYPSEAADQMIDEIVAPYLDRLKGLNARGMNAQANRLCMSLLLGLYQFKHDSTSEFKDWAPDSLSGFAGVVIKVWKEGAPGQSDFQALEAFIESRLDGWEAHCL
jgi:hypothetical protein